jgi:hypothetical protein
MMVQVRCWGEEGHQIIGQIASELLGSTATNIVDQFIGTYTLEEIAPWPDQYRMTPQVT